MKRLILLILILPLVSAGLGINFETPTDTTVNVNTYTGNLTNLSQMADVNIPSPSNDEVLTWSSVTNKWIAKVLTAFDRWIVGSSGGFLYNDSNTIYFNDALLNDTIDSRAVTTESDPLAYNGSLYLTINPYSFYNLTTIPSYVETEVDPYFSANLTAHNDSWTSTYNATYDAYNSTGLIINWSGDYLTEETDPKAYNGTLAYLADIIGWAYYNSTDFDINDYYLKTNPYSFYNLTDFDINNYLDLSTLISFGYWNDTYATFNRTYADSLYADIGVTGDNSSWNQTLADSLYVNIDGDTMTGNLVTENLTAENITATGYLSGQPIKGSIGSGIINTSNVDHNGDVNISIKSETLELTYPDITVLIKESDGDEFYCEFEETTINVTDNQSSVYFTNSSCGLYIDTIENFFAYDYDNGGHISLFHVMAHAGEIETYKGISVKMLETQKVRSSIYYNHHLKIISGIGITTEIFPTFSISSGRYNFLRTTPTTTAQNSSTDGVEIVAYNSGNPSFNDATGLNLTACDDGTSVILCSDQNAYKRYLLFETGFDDGVDTTRAHYLVPLDDESYSNAADCLDLEQDPFQGILPSYYESTAVRIAIYCGRPSDEEWTTNFVYFDRITAGGAVSQDLSIFLTTDGQRSLTANWNQGAFNLTNADSWFLGKIIGSQILNSFSWLNSTTADILYYGINNPYSFYNSTNPQTELDPKAYNGTLMYSADWNATNESYYLKTNPYIFWNDTYATFNRTYADILYYGINNPYSFYNSTNPQTELDPYWSDNFTLYNSSWSSTYNSTYDTWAYNQTIPANAYTDLVNSSQSGWTTAEIILANTSAIAYVDSQDLVYNNSATAYTDSVNSSQYNWIVAQGYSDTTGTVTSVATDDSYLTGGEITTTGTITFNTTLAGTNLSVNSSDYWDGLGSPSDINAADITNDGTYRLESWDNFTGIPTATPSDGDTTHLSTADQIRDYVIGLAYATTTYVDNLIGTYTHLTNFTDDLGDRGYTDLFNFTNSPGYYNSTDFSIGDYYTSSQTDTAIENANTTLYNWVDAQNYLTSFSETDPKAYNGTLAYLADIIGWAYYNSTDFDINDYYLKTNPYSFYNLTTIPSYVETEVDPKWTGNSTNVPYLDTANTFTENQTLEGIIFEKDTTNHKIYDNSTCVIIAGDTSKIYVC